jgi:predicted AAA+ superfamily ATPase
MVRRKIEGNLETALTDTAVVLVHGARQTGKTTLVRDLAARRSEARYFTLDDAAVLAVASADPAGFVGQPGGMVVIDEIQKAPALLPAIKLAVDGDRRPGRFLLTGSAQVLLVPTVSESLAGRMQILTLWPFSQGEIDETPEGFVDAVFGDLAPALLDEPQEGPSLRRRLLRGGYPEVVARPSEARRRAWFAAYLTAILERDVRDLANIAGLTEMPRLLALLAVRAGGLLNKAELSREAALAYATLHRYLSLLEMTFLLRLVPAWSANLGKRLTRAPKIALCDAGLQAHLAGVSEDRLARDPGLAGPLLETFVAMELSKQATWARTAVSLFHFRTAAGREVDLLLEDDAGRVVGIEVKASSSFGRKDLAGLRALAEDLGPRFHRGVLLYAGETVVPAGEKLWALPVSALWRWSAD